MLKTLTRYPTILGASIFIFFGVVYAQVVPDEQPLETEEVATSTPEVIVEEPEVATSSELIIEPVATSTASSSEEVTPLEDEVVVEDDAPIIPESFDLTEATTTESETTGDIAATLESEIIFDSADDITKPSECRNPSALAFFETIGECSRYVVGKIAEEKFERVEREEPKYAPNEEL